jgi:hypothetical protein
MASTIMRKKDEDAADSLLAAVMTIGRPLREVPKKKKNLVNQQWKTETKFKNSRFFYRPTQSLDDELEHRKQIATPKELDLVDQQVIDRSETYGKELPQKLDKNIEKVREFWLKNVAPLTLAAQAGSSQARDVVQRTLGAPIDGTPFLKFQKMLEQGLTIKMATYLVTYLGIPRTQVNDLIDSITPKKEVMVIGPPHEDSERRIRPEKHAPEEPEARPMRESRRIDPDMD